MDRTETIMKRLQEHYDEVASMGYEIVGVFLQGSQNYELDYEGSDIDSKAIVLPKFSDFILRKQEVSTTHVLENNEHVDIKDIRLMFDCFKKQNINFVEILFTKFKIMNPKYEELYQPMFDSAEVIGRYNNYASVNCIAGMAMEKFKALEHPYPATMDKIEKFGYDGKQLSHECRLLEFIKRWISGEKYADCLISKQRAYLVGVKINMQYTLEQAREVGKSVVEDVKLIKNKYMENNPVIVNHEAEKVMHDVLVSIMKRSFIDELSK